MIGRVEETSASFEARSAPRLYPTERLGVKFPGPTRPKEPCRHRTWSLATSNAAGLLKLEDRGVLAVGKLANLSVLDGDPTADIGNSKRIHAVWHRGKQAAGPVEMFTP